MQTEGINKKGPRPVQSSVLKLFVSADTLFITGLYSVYTLVMARCRWKQPLLLAVLCVFLIHLVQSQNTSKFFLIFIWKYDTLKMQHLVK